MPKTAIGRPIAPMQPLAGRFPVYSGSVLLACTACGRQAWFGPRQQALIASHEAQAGCVDCFLAALDDGARPVRLLTLGNPERARYG